MPLSENERRAAIRQAAEVGAEYFKALVSEGLSKDDAIQMANNVVTMFLSSKGVLVFGDFGSDKEDWQK